MSKVVTLNANVIREIYWNQECSQRKTAKQLGICKQTLGKYMRLLGVPRRSHSEAQKVAIEQGENHPAGPGAQHATWAGGRSKTAQGYILAYAPGHPRAKGHNNRYVYEHLLVWEKAHGRPVPEGWHVHHLNGNKGDNRNENLLALPSQNHDRFALLCAVQKELRKAQEELRALKAQQRMELS